MKKTNYVTTLIVACVLSLVITNNTTHAAAARTPDDIAADFIIAIQNNDNEMIAVLELEGVDYQRVFNMAIMDENLNLVQILIKKMKSAHYTDTFVNAAQNGDLNAVRILLAAGAYINRCNLDGMRPLYAAAQNGHIEIVQYLIAQDNIEAIDARHDEDSRIGTAIFTLHRSLFTINKANVDRTCRDGATPLFIAAQNGHTDIVCCLVAQGNADINKAQKMGKPHLG